MSVSEATDTQRVFGRERLKEEVALGIYALMQEYDVNRTELAKRLHKSKPYITRILEGSHNFTLETLSDVYTALGRAVHIVLSTDFDELRLPHDEAIEPIAIQPEFDRHRVLGGGRVWKANVFSLTLEHKDPPFRNQAA